MSDICTIRGEDFEFLEIVVNGELIPPFPRSIYLPSDRRPFFEFEYSQQYSIIATGAVKIVFEKKR